MTIHSGTADSGHYYDYLKMQDSDWYEFNDESVKRINVEELKLNGYGGEGSNRSAYLLLYKKRGE